MPTITLKNTARRGKLAQVLVRNADGTRNRAFRITEAEYAALALPGAGAPPGVTRQEWETNLAIAIGEDCEPGDVVLRPDGSCYIHLDERILADDVQQAGIVLPAGFFSGVPPSITVDAAALAGMNFTLDRNGAQRPIMVAITEIANGVVTWARL